MKKNIIFLLGMLALGAVQMVQGMNKVKKTEWPRIPVELISFKQGLEKYGEVGLSGMINGAQLSCKRQRPLNSDESKRLDESEKTDNKNRIISIFYKDKSRAQKEKIHGNIQGALNRGFSDTVYFPELIFNENLQLVYYVPITTQDVATYLGIVKTNTTNKKNKKKHKQPQQTASTSAVASKEVQTTSM